MTSMQTGRNVIDDGHTILAAQGDAEALRRVIPASVRLLADGKPVSSAQIADAAALPVERVEAALRGVPDVEWTSDGRVEGFGLTRRPTQHTFRVGGVDLYTWCAMDTLIFAAVVDRPVQIESPDGTTGQSLRLETDGRRIVAADPPSMVVSWYFDPAGTGFKAAVCQFGHFFASRESAAAWAAKYPQGGVLSLDEALEAARRLVADVFREAA